MASLDRSESEQARIVRSRRVVLTPMAPGDAPDVIALHLDERVIRHVLDGIPDDARKFGIYLEWANGLAAGGIGVWTARRRDTDVFLGLYTLTPSGDRSDSLEFGGRLCRAGWHGDLAVEAGGALIDFAFATLRVAKLTSVFHPANRTAPVALARLGFAEPVETTVFGTVAVEVRVDVDRWRTHERHRRPNL